MHCFKTKFILYLLFFIPVISKAQNCNCGENFKYLVERIKKNYAGYNDKANGPDKNRFEVFTDSLQQEANKTTGYQCKPLLSLWLSYFKDRHMGIVYDDSGYTKDALRLYYAKEERTDWAGPSLNSYLRQNQLDDVEGIWNNRLGTYEIGIVRDKIHKDEFIGYIIKADSIRWTPGQVKFRIVKKNNRYLLKYFRASDHSINPLPFSKTNDTLNIGEGVYGQWYKNGHFKPLSNNVSEKGPSGPKFKILDDKTCLFEMPTVALVEYALVMDSLIKQNVAALRKCTHLIIDLRNNSGGSVLMYKKLIPLIYTNPILTEGASVLATEDNIRDYYEKIPKNVSDSMKRIFERNLSTLKDHKGEVYNLYKVDTIKLDKVLDYPKHVSILVNKYSASAAELFILQAKQSTKVKLYGTNSAGAIDYLEVVRTKMPCNFYTVNYPAAKSFRLPQNPLDNIGIKPDVAIPINVSDWINYVKDDVK